MTPYDLDGGPLEVGAPDDRDFVTRVAEDREHFPWWYTEFGVQCSCGRPCNRDEDCAVMVRARRWQGVTP